MDVRKRARKLKLRAIEGGVLKLERQLDKRRLKLLALIERNERSALRGITWLEDWRELQGFRQRFNEIFEEAYLR